jgi:hypothetical protein
LEPVLPAGLLPAVAPISRLRRASEAWRSDRDKRQKTRSGRQVGRR